MQWKIFGKYFLHGILFSVFFLLLGIAWIFMMILLVSLGAIIGFIIGIGLLFLIEALSTRLLEYTFGILKQKRDFGTYSFTDWFFLY